MKNTLFTILIPLFILAQTEISPVYIGLGSNVVGAEFRGIAATITDGLTVTGSFISDRRQYKFPVLVTGPYKLWIDTGSGFFEDTTWAGTGPDGVGTFGGDIKAGLGSGGGGSSTATDTIQLKITGGDAITLLGLSGTNRDGGGDLIKHSDSDYSVNSITVYPHPDAGFVWVRLEYVNGVLDISWAGVIGDGINDDAANFQKMVDYVFSVGGGIIGTSAESGKIYNLNGNSITIPSKIIIDFQGINSTTVFQSGDAPAFIFNTGIGRSALKNMYIRGPGKSFVNSIGIFATTVASMAESVFENVNIDSFYVGVKNHDVTDVSFHNVNFRWNHISLWISFNSDAHYYESCKFYDSDTGVVIKNFVDTVQPNANPVTFQNCIFGRDSVAFKFHNEISVVNILGCYFENDRHEGIFGNPGDAGTAGNVINIEGNFWQGTVESGFTNYQTGDFNFVNNWAAGGPISSEFITIVDNNCRFTAYGNKVQTSDPNVRFQGGNFTRNLNSYVEVRKSKESFFNSNVLSGESAVKATSVINASDSYLQKWRRTNSTSETEQYHVAIRDITNLPYVFLSKGGVIFGENAGNPILGNTAIKGALMHFNDKLYWYYDVGGGQIDSVQVAPAVGQTVEDDTIRHMFYANDIYNENAAGYSDPTRSTILIGGSERTILSFADNVLSGMQIYFSPQTTIPTSGNVWLSFYWYSQTATTGDVVIGFQLGTYRAGSSANVGFSAATTITVPTNGTVNTVTRSQITRTFTSEITPRDVIVLRPRRTGTDGADTMVGDMELQFLIAKYLK